MSSKRLQIKSVIVFSCIYFLQVFTCSSQTHCTLNPEDSLYYKEGMLCNGFDTVLYIPRSPSFYTVSHYTEGMINFAQDFEYGTWDVNSSKILYENNRIVDGIVTYFHYGTRNPSQKYTYKNGMLNGLYRMYSEERPNYVVEYGYHQNGLKEGVFLMLTDSGRLFTVKLYIHNELRKKIDYYLNGNEYESANWVTDTSLNIPKLDGPFWRYYPDGSVMMTGVYDYGKPIHAFRYWNKNNLDKMIRYDSLGNEIETIKYIYDGLNLIETVVTKPE